MGKRIEKAFGKDKSQASGAQDATDDDPNKTPEPYISTGQFQNDFHELCRRNSMVVIPSVVARPRRPPSPAATPAVEEKGNKTGKKDDKKNQPPPDPEPEVEDPENEVDPPPKTYTTKDKFEYFKPAVQVEMDNPDKQDTVTEIYVRGWKIDEPMMNIFKQCWPKLDRLHTINLWNTGLTDETLEILAAFLPDCLSIKNLILDNNPVKGERYDLFMKDESPVQYLSLRYNNITDKGAEHLGVALGTPQLQNTKLLNLNLNGNAITDTGVSHLAKGLRMNRTLLSLGLANNRISDKGADNLSEVLSRFPLTHEEIVERRKLFSEKGSPERKSPPPGSRRADSRDRPGSVRSSHAGQNKGGKSAKTKKIGDMDEEATDSRSSLGQQGSARRSSVFSREDAKGGKEDEKSKGKKEAADKNAKKASVVADAGKNAAKKGDKGKTKGKGPAAHETEEAPEVVNPLLDTVEHMDNGVVMLIGNRNLISLNLAHNQIGEEGTKALHSALIYQTSLSQFSSHMKPGSTGLMRICLTRNLVPRDSETLKKLNALMATKDPFYKAPPISPDQESTAHSKA